MDKDAIPKKSKPAIRARGKKVIEHHCEKEEIIKRLSLFAIGNGNPQKGFLFKIEKATSDINSINKELKGINENHNVLLAEITRVGGELIQFRSNMEGWKTGKDDAEEKEVLKRQLEQTKKRDTRFMVFNIIALCLTLTGVGFAILFGFRNSKQGEEIQSEQKTTNEILAPPTTRGQHYNPFANDTLKTK